jgi:hypothetical protein
MDENSLKLNAKPVEFDDFMKEILRIYS